MKNYMNGEMYKLFRRKSVWFFLAILVVILFVMRMVLPFLGLTQDMVLRFSYLIMLGIHALILGFIPLFTDDIKNGTLKNYVTTDIRVKQIFRGKIVVQLVSAVFLLVFMLPLLLYAISALPVQEEYMGDVWELAGKILLSVPSFITSLFVADYLALIIKNEIVICLAYYYGYIQVFALMVFAGCNISEGLACNLILPIQLGKMYSEKLSVNNGGITFGIGCVYCLAVWLLLNNQLDKKEKNEDCYL